MDRRLAIDTSHWDGVVDFSAWKSKRGLWGAIVKAGGNERGLGRYSDQLFWTNYQRAKNMGLHVGSYYYTVSTDVESAEADARHFVSLLEGAQLDLPIYMDVEDAAQFELSPQALTDVIVAFCEACAVRGFKPGLYTGGNAWLYSMLRDKLYKYADWIAWWRGSWPTEAGDIGMWQQGTMRLSDGTVFFDDISGCTDCDWCIVDYPSQIVSAGLNGYAKVEVPTVKVKNRLTYNEMAAEVCEHIINHDAHGYSQTNRMGDGTVESITLSDGTTVTIHGRDYDCSELMRMCFAAVGVLPYDSYMWTGNEYDLLTENGFVVVDVEDAQRGDVLLRNGHTEMYLGNNLQGGARIDEDGTIYGRQGGDQTGFEICSSEFQPWRWELCFRSTKVRPEEVPAITQDAGDPKNDLGIHYRMHSQSVGWLPPVHDGQTAGTVGFSKRGEAIKITPPEGMELEVMVHVEGLGTLWYEGVKRGKSSGTRSSANDPIMGTVGKSMRMEAVRIRITKRPKAFKDKKIMLQGHVQGIGWQEPVTEDQWCGTLGESRRLEALRIWFE